MDLGRILEFTSDLHDRNNIKTIVSSGNCKISVYDPAMKNTPGMAAKVFAAAASVQTDIRIITTSEVEISLLVTEADFNEALQSVEEAVK
jgi:aspartate kinase